MNVTVDTRALTACIREVSASVDRAAPRIVTHLEASVQATFDSEGAAGGNLPWKDTTLTAFGKRRTQAGKDRPSIMQAYRSRSGWKTLTDTGRLRKSWRGKSSRSGSVTTVTVEPGVPYAVQIHAGGPATIEGRAVTLPERMVNLRNADEGKVEAILTEEILRG